MEDLLPYFERELVYLRSIGREFYERYPRVGGALQQGDDTCPDPHVEQLIQSVALLSARVAKRLDDSYPELTEALLETLFPHYLRPFPSCSIVRATYPSIKSAGEAPVLTIPRGTEMDSRAVDGVRYSSKTAYHIVLSLFMRAVCAYVETEPGRWTALPAVPLALRALLSHGCRRFTLHVALACLRPDSSLGAGAAVVKAWILGGVNGTRRQVKYSGAE